MSKKILIMTAVAAERDAVLRGLGSTDRFEVVIAGVGPIEAAIRTTSALHAGEYSLVISAGIAGGFAGRADVADVVVASRMIAADLGAESPDGFISLDKLGFGSSTIEVDEPETGKLTSALRAKGLPVCCGPVLTVSTVTGSAETARSLAERIPGAAAEAMEGFGVGTAARIHGLPVIELRTISNPVGPRDRSAWRIREALDALEAVSNVLQEVYT
jgi:futalosine hydrolase